LQAFWVNKCSSTYWEGNAQAESLQRVYAISFPDKKLLTEHKTLLEEAAKRDHRKIGREQELFFFHELRCVAGVRPGPVSSRLCCLTAGLYPQPGLLLLPAARCPHLQQAHGPHAGAIREARFALAPHLPSAHPLLLRHHDTEQWASL
jgi:hypothetical protein